MRDIKRAISLHPQLSTLNLLKVSSASTHAYKTLFIMNTTFQFPPSVQSDLFNYLKPEQQEFIKPILRVLKKPAQTELCCSLLDYLESGEVIAPEDFTLGALFFYITRSGGGFKDEPENKKILRPLHYRSNVPMKVGEIIDRFFPMLKK